VCAQLIPHQPHKLQFATNRILQQRIIPYSKVPKQHTPKHLCCAQGGSTHNDPCLPESARYAFCTVLCVTVHTLLCSVIETQPEHHEQAASALHAPRGFVGHAAVGRALIRAFFRIPILGSANSTAAAFVICTGGTWRARSRVMLAASKVGSVLGCLSFVCLS
jgi:hypothetical protein